MKKLILTMLSLAAVVTGVKGATTTEATHKLLSPDQKYEFTFYHDKIDDHRKALCYSVVFDGETVVEKSVLGVLIENQLFESALGVPNEENITYWCENLNLTDVKYSETRGSWNPIYGERAVVNNDYNEMTLNFLKGESTTQNEYNKFKSYYMDIEVRAYNTGVAFRYHFPEALNGLFLHIVGEQTSFTMPQGSTAYFANRAQGHYSARPLEGWGKEESERPLTLKLPSGKFVTLAEARMVDYVRGKFALCDKKPSTLVLSMYDCADVITPYDTPWRVVMAANDVTEIANNNDIILNLNPECAIEDTSWIKPGKVYRSGLKQEQVMTAIDFAAARNYKYVHLDAGWYGLERQVASDATKEDPRKPDLNIKKLCEYAKSKDMGVFLYVNMRALVSQLDDMLPIYKEWGVSGIKFGFVQIGNQRWSTWLHEAVKKCAEYEILVDIHDEYRPTGFSRTYPNLMTQEGIAGNEEFPNATHNTILPFTRFVAGAGDYTFAYYDKRNKNTFAHQLTLPIMYYSPLQFMHWYDTPDEYDNEPEMALWSAIPTVWDDSRTVEAVIGEYVIQSRRSGDEWYVGAITNTEGREVTIKLAEILDKGTYMVSIYEDDPSLDTKSKVKTSQRKVKSTQTLKFNLQPSGGVALHFVPVK